MLNSNVLVFDIETVADIDAYRLLNGGLAELSDADVYQLMCSERRSESGTEFMRHHLYKVVAISLILRSADGDLKLWTLGRDDDNEYELIHRFFKGIERFCPTLVSWNGSGFDLPVLHYRALFHGVDAGRYFEIGEEHRDFRYNNYLSRFHWRHIDMMDVLAGYQMRSAASLNDVAKLCGFPGKLDVDGSAVQTMWDEGQIEDICNYCETDVLNTYLVYLRFEQLRGNLNTTALNTELDRVRQLLMQSNASHLQYFLKTWQAA